jgi:hypothetical protein
MEVEGPLYDDSTTAGYKLLFGDLPLKANLEVASNAPEKDAERLMRGFLKRGLPRPESMKRMSSALWPWSEAGVKRASRSPKP